MNGSGGRSRLLAGGLLFLVAVVAFLGGVVLDRAVLRPDPGNGAGGVMHADSNEQRGHPDERIVDRMAADLDLSAGQRERLARLLARQHERLSAAMAEARPRLDRILEETHREIEAILDPAQRERFQGMWRAHH